MVSALLDSLASVVAAVAVAVISVAVAVAVLAVAVVVAVVSRVGWRCPHRLKWVGGRSVAVTRRCRVFCAPGSGGWTRSRRLNGPAGTDEDWRQRVEGTAAQ